MKNPIFHSVKWEQLIVFLRPFSEVMYFVATPYTYYLNKLNGITSPKYNNLPYKSYNLIFKILSIYRLVSSKCKLALSDVRRHFFFLFFLPFFSKKRNKSKVTLTFHIR